MIDTLLSLIGGFKGLITGALALLGGLFGLWYKAKAGREQARRERAESANQVYQAKEEVRQHDITEDYNREQQIDELRDKVDNAPNQEGAANEVSGAINEYFSRSGEKT